MIVLYKIIPPSIVTTVEIMSKKVVRGKIKFTAEICVLARARDSITSAGRLASGKSRSGIKRRSKNLKTTKRNASVIITQMR